MSQRIVMTVAAAALLAGCGAKPSGAPGMFPPAPPADSQVGLPTTMGEGPDQKAIALAFAMVDAVRNLRTARYQAVTYCHGNVGKRPSALKKLADGCWEATTTTIEQFTAPGHYDVQVGYGGDPTFAGAKLAIDGSAITVTWPGMWAGFPKHATANDPALKDFRGQRRDDMDFQGLARRLGGSAKAHFVGTFSKGGGAVSYVEVTGSVPSDPTVVREVLGIQTVTNLPVSLERFTKAGKVFSRTIQALQLDPNATSQGEGGAPIVSGNADDMLDGASD